MDTDESQSGESEKSNGQRDGPAHIELVRVRHRTIHISPQNWQREIEYTVRNGTSEEFNYLFLPLRGFVRNLQIHDENGDLLNYYPNREVEAILESVKDSDADAFQRMRHRFKHADYQLFIQLSPDRPIEPGELRTVQLSLEESNPVKYYRIWDPPYVRGLLAQWEKKFFRIPTFVADAERFPGHPHDEFLIIVGSPGYSTIGESELEGTKPENTIYENGLDDETRVVSIRLPPAEKRYSYDLEYDLIPNSRPLMQILAIFWISALVLGIAALLISYNGWIPNYSGIGKTTSAAFLTLIVGLLFALDTEWSVRYRLLCVIPLIIHATAWIIWNFQPFS